MKVVHVEAGRHMYGGALQVQYLLQGLQDYDIENILVCPIGSEIGKRCQNVAKVIEVEMKGDLDIGMAFRIRDVLKQEQADLLHLHSRRGADIWGALAAKLAGVKVMLTRRVDNAEPIWFAKLKYNTWYDHVAAISEGIRQVLLSECVSEQQVTTIRSAVDTQLFTPDPDSVWFEDEFGYRQEHFVIGIVAQLIERKGHQVLLDALPSLVNDYPHIRVMVLGKGPLKDQLHQSVQSMGLADTVKFFGFRNDIQRVLPNLSLVVHPAFIEGLGVALLQASSSGVPVVACRTGGIPEAIADGENGILVSPGSSAELSQAIKTLVSEQNLHRNFRLNGRERMVSQFSVDTMTKLNFNTYQSILAKP